MCVSGKLMIKIFEGQKCGSNPATITHGLKKLLVFKKYYTILSFWLEPIGIL